MINLVHDTIGLVHVISALFALAFGTSMLIMTKGTRIHKRIGYMDTFFMLILMNFSVIGLYSAFFSEVLVRLPGTSFVFTVTLASILTVVIGMWVFRKKKSTWLNRYSRK